MKVAALLDTSDNHENLDREKRSKSGGNEISPLPWKPAEPTQRRRILRRSRNGAGPSDPEDFAEPKNSTHFDPHRTPVVPRDYTSPRRPVSPSGCTIHLIPRRTFLAAKNQHRLANVESLRPDRIVNFAGVDSPFVSRRTETPLKNGTNVSRRLASGWRKASSLLSLVTLVDDNRIVLSEKSSRGVRHQTRS